MKPAENAIAAIDIGSDTIHLLVGVPSGPPDARVVQRLEQRGELIELGRRVARKGRIGEGPARELETLLLDYVRRARKRTDRIIIGATEALRRASDGPALVEQLGQRVGLPVQVLAGQREAQLGFAGVAHRLEETGPQLLIDSGGASTELTICDGRKALAAASLPVGAALLGASLVGDPPDALSWALGGTLIGRALATAPTGTPLRAFATGGSAHNLAGLERIRGREGLQVLTVAALQRAAEQLLSVPSVRLARRSGEDPRRVAILPPGLLIVAAVLDHYHLDRVTVVPEGLRDGMVLAAADQGDDWWRSGGTA
jgi:exopolyphosphatase/guanosine-5'-triphosphate,3'-diphosphate pyrophosphatase